MYSHGNKFANFKLVRRIKETRNLLSKDNHYSVFIIFFPICSDIFYTATIIFSNITYSALIPFHGSAASIHTGFE